VAGGYWTPTLRVRELDDGRCRLSLVAIADGVGPTLQEAGDDLVANLLTLVMSLRAPGMRMAPGLGPLDRRSLGFLWDLGDIASRGGDIRHHVFGYPELPDAVA